MSSSSSNRPRHSVNMRRTCCTALSALCALALFPGCTRSPATSSPAAKAPSLQVRVKNSPKAAQLRVALAHELAGAGETFAAIEQLEAARALGDSDPQRLNELAQSYVALGEPETAAETLSAVANRSEVVMPLAGIYLQLGDFQRSVAVLQPLRKNWAAQPVATQQAVVRAYLLAGDAETGARLLPRAQADTAQWQELAGLQALVAGQPKQAAAALLQAVTFNPQDAWDSYLLGRAWLLAGDRRRAMDVWSAALQGPDAPPQEIIATARLLAEDGRLDQADALLDRVQGDGRKLPAYWHTAAVIAHRRKHAAIEQIALGYAAYNEGDPWQAEAIWQRALPLASDELARQIYAALSNSAARRMDAQTALHFAAIAAGRWPQDPESQRQHAEMLLAQGQVTEAQAAAQRFQAIAPSERQAQAAELLSRIALDSNKPDLLQQSVQRDRTLAPADPMPLLHLAEWQGQQGHDPANLERTLALYQEAQRLAPTNAEAAARTGLILADLKRTDEAISTLLHALSLDPRVLDGSPNALLAQLDARQGKELESRFEMQRYQRVRALKDAWPNLLKTLRQERPLPPSSEWKALGEMALRRHENWIALCAFVRLTRLTPADPQAWSGLAAVQKRLGWFEEALDSMRRVQLLSGSSGRRAER